MVQRRIEKNCELQLRIASCQELILIKLEASRIELQWRKSISELLCTFTAESDKKFFNVTRNVRSPNFARRAHYNTKMQESASHHFIMCEIDLQLRIAGCQELILIKIEASRIELQ